MTSSCCPLIRLLRLETCVDLFLSFSCTTSVNTKTKLNFERVRFNISLLTFRAVIRACRNYLFQTRVWNSPPLPSFCQDSHGSGASGIDSDLEEDYSDDDFRLGGGWNPTFKRSAFGAARRRRAKERKRRLKMKQLGGRRRSGENRG